MYMHYCLKVLDGMFLMLLKEVSSADQLRLNLFDQNTEKNSNIVKYFYNLK